MDVFTVLSAFVIDRKVWKKFFFSQWTNWALLVRQTTTKGIGEPRSFKNQVKVFQKLDLYLESEMNKISLLRCSLSTVHFLLFENLQFSQNCVKNLKKTSLELNFWQFHWRYVALKIINKLIVIIGHCSQNTPISKNSQESFIQYSKKSRAAKSNSSRTEAKGSVYLKCWH